MAYFDEIELIDAIRHSFIVNDDSGICDALLDRPSKRMKPGGLPREFFAKAERVGYFSNADDEQDDPMSVSPEILADGPSRMRTNTIKQMEQMQKARRRANVTTVQWKDPQQQPVMPNNEETVAHDKNNKNFATNKPTHLNNNAAAATAKASRRSSSGANSPLPPPPVPFEEKPVVKAVDRMPFTSTVSTSVEQNPAIAANPFAKFARFAATLTDRFPHQAFIIFVPFARDQPCVLNVDVHSTAKVADLIGLCCFKYTAQCLTPSIITTTPTHYQLLMADESGDIETDLPALSPNDTIGRLGFSALALVQKPVVLAARKTTHPVVVYMTNGHKYQFDLESLDVTLEWLRDHVLERRKTTDMEANQQPSHRREINEYVMEALNVRDELLPLDTTVEQAGTLEFLMLRKNSSRGDFMTPMQKRVSVNDVEYGLTDSVEQFMLADPVGMFKNREQRLRAQSSRSLSTFADVDEFTVNRVHKYKPKWTARLVFKNDCLELIPSGVGERKLSLLPTQKKTVTVTYAGIGGAVVGEDRQFGPSFSAVYVPLSSASSSSLQLTFRLSPQSDARRSFIASNTVRRSPGTPSPRKTTAHKKTGSVDWTEERKEETAPNKHKMSQAALIGFR